MSRAILTDQTTSRQVSTKDLLIRAAAVLFSQKGYSATTLDDLAKMCAIRRGSIFYHFSSKHEIAIATVNYFYDQCEKAIFTPTLTYQCQDAKQRLLQLANAIHDFYTERDDLNLIPFLSLEIGDQSIELHAVFEQLNTTWGKIFEFIYAQCKPVCAYTPEIVLSKTLCFIHGYCLLKQTYQKQAILSDRTMPPLPNLADGLLHLWQGVGLFS